MKKNLIAVAVAAALVAPAAALADTTLYGKAHLSLDSIDDGQDSAIYLSSNSSRLGVKGSEDLGNGMTVLFQLEGGVNWDGGGSWGATRDTYVGIAGSGGTFLAGRLPARNQWLYDADLFADQLGDTGNLLGWTPGRASNALHYVAPGMGGLGIALTYVPDENAAGDSDIWGARLTYGNGPLFVGLTHFNADASPDNLSETALTASFDFDSFKLVGAVVSNDEGSTDSTDWTIGAAAGVGAGTLKLQYAANGETSSQANDGANMWAIGYDYPLSKRTSVYGVYARTNNDAAANFSMAGWGHGDDPGAAAAGEDPSGFSFGLVHSF